ncbi:hypothetical protein [Eoetvoesiella caeni]|nr:hypothetical protein [Eoetvoesiella caeni]
MNPIFIGCCACAKAAEAASKAEPASRYRTDLFSIVLSPDVDISLLYFVHSLYRHSRTSGRHQEDETDIRIASLRWRRCRCAPFEETRRQERVGHNRQMTCVVHCIRKTLNLEDLNKFQLML